LLKSKKSTIDCNIFFMDYLSGAPELTRDGSNIATIFVNL